MIPIIIINCVNTSVTDDVLTFIAKALLKQSKFFYHLINEISTLPI